MALFAKHSDSEYFALGKELEAARAQLATFETDAAAELAKRDATIAAAEKAIKAESEAKAAEATQRQGLQAQVADLQGKLKAESEAKAAEVTQRQGLQAQVADLQGKLKAESEAKAAEVTQRQGETQKRVALEKELADVRSQINTETAAKESEINKSKDLQEENDLLLAQLHQVQEELERYYLNNKELEAGMSEITTTLKLARQSLVNTLIDIRGFAVAAITKAPSVASKVVKLPSRLRPPPTSRKRAAQRASARKSSRSR
jgi:chromosome segregation ATPase